jgi:hypothetical protein
MAAVMTFATISCSGANGERSSDASAPGERSGVPGAEARPPALRPLGPDEVVVERATGSGAGRVSGTSGAVVIVYAVCDHGRSAEVRTDFPRVAPQNVPCDGVVSRNQIYTLRDRPFRVDLDAAPSTSWELLVTRRSE